MLFREDYGLCVSNCLNPPPPIPHLPLKEKEEDKENRVEVRELRKYNSTNDFGITVTGGDLFMWPGCFTGIPDAIFSFPI